jgi:hypothetical protein
LLHELDTEAAFLDVALLFDDANVIRTGGDAILAADTGLFVDQYDSVRAFIGGSRRAHRDTGRVIAMLALDRHKLPLNIRKDPIFPFLQKVVCLIFTEIILVLARYATGIAAHAFRLIDYHSIPWHNSPF